MNQTKQDRPTSSLTPTNFEVLREMPNCQYATPECFCRKHFAEAGGVAALGDIAAKLAASRREYTTDTKASGCPQGRIVTIGRDSSLPTTVIRVNKSVFST